jgi:hypothetical protein
VAVRVEAKGRILPPTRVGVWVLFVLALANGAYLYLVPGSADTDYAWPIRPPVNAAFLGAGFLAGTLATALVLFATRRWRSLATLLRAVRALSCVCGGALVAGAAALYVAPVDVVKHWPWALTPLLARAVAAWYAMVGTMLLCCAAQLRRRTEAVIPYATLGAWCLLLLALPVLHPDDVTRSGGDFVAWVAVMVALLALSGLALTRSLPWLRSEGL